MDAFNILSRSTNLSRKRTTPNQPHPNARLTKAQLDGGNADLKHTTNEGHVPEGNSSKRKRDQANQQGETTLPQELDFFSSRHTGTSKNANGVATAAKVDAAKGQIVGQGGGEEDARPPAVEADLPEDECRRILKSHKLKITRLDSPVEKDNTQDTNGSKKRKRVTKAVTPLSESKKKKSHQLDVTPQPLTKFSQLRSRYHIDARLATNLEDQGFLEPTEVQLAALPLLLRSTTQKEKNPSVDLLAIAPTGSGKTLAFLIPVLDSITRRRKRAVLDKKSGHDTRPPGPEAVIIAPTKELANQIVGEAKKLAMGTGVEVALVRKGMHLGSEGQAQDPRLPSADESDSDEDDQPRATHSKDPPLPDVLVTTPLTLVRDLLLPDGTATSMPTVRHLVLDEADVLLDSLFRKQTLAIWSACSNPSLRLTCWSATMGASIEDIVASTIDSRAASSTLISKDPAASRAPLLRLVVGLKDSAIPHITHKLVYCGSENGKLLALRQLLRPNTGVPTAGSTSPSVPTLRPPFLVFTQSIPRAQALASELLYEIPASAGGQGRISVLHAGLSSSQRRRVMDATRRGEIWVLITTDLLSRGVDFRGVNGVVNYDLPTSAAGYVHRVGRTGRAGREGGVAVTLYEKGDLRWVKGVVNVIAASERARGGAFGEKVEGLDQWLLDSLPKVGKRDRQRLKKRGVEERRPDWLEQGTRGEGLKGKGKEKGVKTGKISTKSGWEKRAEDRRRGAIEGSRRRAMVGTDDRAEDTHSDFEGFD